MDAFQRSLANRFPENLILSHDLLEGCYAGAGLISDVELYEEYPSQYSADVDRRYRWIRGDWQIARWLFPGIPGPDGHMQKNPLTMLSRWKIFDNLRRSLTAASLTLLLLLGWMVLASPWFWTLAVMGSIVLPFLPPAALKIFQKPVDVRLDQHLIGTLISAGRQCLQAAITLMCLPHEAFYSLDAMVRTIWRMMITHQHLLEWNPSAGTGGNHCPKQAGLGSSFKSMWAAPTIAVASALTLFLLKPASLLVAGPILILWLFSPAVSWWISQSLEQPPEKLTTDQTVFLHGLSRKTWAFFETFVGPEDHWLPPDNYQEIPVGVIAHRTSPTNMGLALLTNLAAYDFGYISAGNLILRTTHTLNTMTTLERHRGHFYNWYDTLSLAPLLPRYISSVDSGNLAGHLLTLRPGLQGLIHDTITGRRLFQGLSDTFNVLLDQAGDKFPARLTELHKELEQKVNSPPVTLTGTQLCLNQLLRSAEGLEMDVKTMDSDLESPLRGWTLAFAGQCRNALDELILLSSWTDLLSSLDKPHDMVDLDMIPTLAQVTLMDARYLPEIEHRLSLAIKKEEKTWLNELARQITASGQEARKRFAAIERLCQKVNGFARMEYDFLFDAPRRLLSIGYNVSENQRDSGYYDLLASEARFASFVAIAQGQLPQENWFALERVHV